MGEEEQAVAMVAHSMVVEGANMVDDNTHVYRAASCTTAHQHSVQVLCTGGLDCLVLRLLLLSVWSVLSAHCTSAVSGRRYHLIVLR
jgi:hypothetical protein